MSDEPKASVQGIIDALMERIAALEFEVAVLKSALQSQPRQVTEEPDEPEEAGPYL
jgi:hypothetical protein